MHEVAALLDRAAGEMPPARLPDDLWRRGRRRRWARRLAAATAAVAVTAGSVVAPIWLLHRPVTMTGDGPMAPILPTSVHRPWLWQATAGQWPPGAAAVLFYTNRTRYLEDTGVVVGRGGAYRLIPMTVGEERGVLSPDGRTYVRPGPEPVDLVTGDTRRAGAEEWRIRPLAWSPDGRWLLAGRSNGDGVTEYADDGRVANQPNLLDDLVAFDLSTGDSRTVLAGRLDRYDWASWSPDGTSIAVTGPPTESGGNQLVVLDLATGATTMTVALGPNQRLAGRQAWSPDGARIAVVGAVDTPPQGSLEYRSATDGRPLGPSVEIEGTPGELLGWLDDEPVLTTVRGTGNPRVSLDVVRGDGRQDILIEGPPGSTGMDVPRDLIHPGAFGAPAARPSPFAPSPLLLGAAVLPVVVFLYWRGRRRFRAVGLRPGRAGSAG